MKRIAFVFFLWIVCSPLNAQEDVYYYIESGLFYKLVLTPKNYSKDAKKEIQIKKIHEYNSKLRQHWEIRYAAANQPYFYIINRISKYALDVKNGDRNIRAAVWTYTLTGSDAQQWKKVDAGDGFFYIQSKLGYYLDVRGGQGKDGTQVWTYTLNRGRAQKWKFKPVEKVFEIPAICNYCRTGTSLKGAKNYKIEKINYGKGYFLSYQNQKGNTNKIFNTERREDITKIKKVLIDRNRIDNFCNTKFDIVIPRKNGKLLSSPTGADRWKPIHIIDLNIRKGQRVKNGQRIQTWDVYSRNQRLFRSESKKQAAQLICLLKNQGARKVCEIGGFRYITR